MEKENKLIIIIRINRDVSKKEAKNGHRLCGGSYPWHIFPVYHLHVW